jgi:hypothetical protein
MGFKCLQMEIFIKDFINMVNLMGKDNTNGQMEQNIMVFLKAA